MFDQVYQFVLEQLGKNDLIAGGAVLGAIAFLTAQLRNVPMTVARWMRLLLVTHVDIPDRSESFTWVSDWLSSHSYSRKSRRITIEGHGKTIKTTPAPGNHFIWWRGRPVILKRVRKEGTGDNAHRAFRESWSITIFGRRRGIENFIEECRAASKPEEAKYIRIRESSRDYWCSPNNRKKRGLDTVIMPDRLLEGIMEDINKFCGSEDWYDSMSIPWRRGYLLTGPPGNGKSSLVTAIASTLDYPVYILNLSQVVEDEISGMMRQIDGNSILLLEDIDCAFEERDKEYGVTMSTLLNILDGVNAAEGRIVIMTTNHPEKLDPALIRPGRVDVIYHIGNATVSQIERLYKRFYPEGDRARGFAIQAEKFGPSMAKVQGHLLRYKDSEAEAYKRIKDLAHG